MARFAALFCAVVAAATSAAAAAVQERDSALITFFTDINYLGQEFTYSGTVPTGCIPLSPPFVSSVSSVQIANGVRCTLWNETECGRAPGKSITLNGNVPNFVNLEFNDLDPHEATSAFRTSGQLDFVQKMEHSA
ncbi:hypothetical protein B0H14DRAFT_2598728 [Mycena olivaceomarginata]|nr:hypothetical protein B0H14DRAFT_2598725 [Mycena olivaceomarginata]KAJ7822216.1 hypothetical protein B0H14DRAFT_2598728 [Mycena olivaceomarginata]